MTLDNDHRAQLAEQLHMKRRLLHEAEMTLARAGLSADPAATIRRDDLKSECRDLERQLGMERPAPPPQPRVSFSSPPPEPNWSFQATYTARQVSERQRDVAHQQELLRIYRGNLKHYQNQAQMLGAFAPPMVAYGIEAAHKGIQAAKAALRSHGQLVDDLASDE